jgi:Fe-S cluster biogenesis protein NfuA
VPDVAMGRHRTGPPGSMAWLAERQRFQRFMRTQVEETIEVIRPALQADGGDIILRDVDEGTGVITVTLVGACGTCPASTQTLKAGIERIMRDRVDGVTEVVNV